MTENEEIKVEMDEGVIEAGGEEELKFKEAKKKQEELIVKQKAAEEEKKKEEDEKNEASVENEPNETSPSKGSEFDLERVKDQDISQYLWDKLLDAINYINKKGYTWLMNGVDSGLSKREIGPAKPESTKEEKVKHTCKRGKGLYEAGKEVADNFEKSVAGGEWNLSLKPEHKGENEKMKAIMVRACKIAYDMTVSEFLYEKMSKDKNFDFATMDKQSVIKEMQSRISEKQEKLMSGVMATFYYSDKIELMSPDDVLKACNGYLDIRENEAKDIKDLITKDLEKGNFIGNDKNPSRDISVKMNAYERSFNNDAFVIHTTFREDIENLKANSSSEKEKLSLEEFQKKAQVFQSFESGAMLDLQKQIKALDQAYKDNKSRPIRTRIKEMKKNLGLKPVSLKIQGLSNNVSEFKDSAVLRAVKGLNRRR